MLFCSAVEASSQFREPPTGQDPSNSASTLVRLCFDSASTLFDSASSLKNTPGCGVESFHESGSTLGNKSAWQNLRPGTCNWASVGSTSATWLSCCGRSRNLRSMALRPRLSDGFAIIVPDVVNVRWFLC